MSQKHKTFLQNYKQICERFFLRRFENWLKIAALLILVPTSRDNILGQPFVPNTPDPIFEPWRWRSFPQLKGKGINCMTEASDGSIWFGADAGIYRYDGLHWQEFTPADGLGDAPITNMLGAKDGTLFASTEYSIYKFVDSKWRLFFTFAKDPVTKIYDLLQSKDGSIWAGTRFGAVNFSTSTAIF